jgi:hypothetical protein
MPDFVRSRCNQGVNGMAENEDWVDSVGDDGCREIEMGLISC